MKRSEIHAGDVLLLNDSPKWDDETAYQFGGSPVVVLSEERYYVRPADAWRYGYDRDTGPQLDPKGTGVLVGIIGNTIEGSVLVGERVVKTTALRGDWHELSADQETRAAAKKARENSIRDARANAREDAKAAHQAVYDLGFESVAVVDVSSYDGYRKIALSASDAESIVAEMIRLREHVKALGVENDLLRMKVQDLRNRPLSGSSPR